MNTQWVINQLRGRLVPEPPAANARLPFDLDDQIDQTLITTHAGVPLVIELFRRSVPQRWAMSRF